MVSTVSSWASVVLHPAGVCFMVPLFPQSCFHFFSLPGMCYIQTTAKLSSHCKNDTEAASEATYSICHNRDFMAAGVYTVYTISITKNNCSLAQWHLLFPVHNWQKARCILNAMKTTKFEVYATLHLHKITKYPCVFKNSAPSALNKSIFSLLYRF